MALSSGIIKVLVDQNMDARLAKAFAMGLVFVGQFLANTFWTFGKLKLWK
jgi:putative flippase GtrA